jgi:hypothetical protein
VHNTKEKWRYGVTKSNLETINKNSVTNKQ